MTGKSIATAAAAGVLALTAGGHPAAQTTGPQTPPLVIASMAGTDLFRAYCASCHGRGGKGDGPTAAALKTAVPDLTTLAKRSGGTFPRARVQALVSHGEDLSTSSHGSRQMPVWGPIFQALDPNDTRTAVRISNIVEYVESIQVR